ncbi:MAG TPA: outer membrane lipoprotein-sorting protein [Porticoccaceae bacterium]|nr:outer membrane lipoprotein-sorting protein [Porticoccaceae bacterium]
MNARRFLLTAAMLALPPCVQGEALPDGASVAARINARDEGEHMSRHMTLILTDRGGKQRIRDTIAYRRYVEGEKHTAIYFASPNNLKGTAFLTYDYQAPEREDDNWLYLPALRKARRISAADRGDYFLGTDMTYEDIKLETRVSDDYQYRTLRADTVDGHQCLWVEAVPRTESLAREIGYQRVENCIDSTIWMARQTRFWDLAGNALKTAHIGDIQQVQGIWTPGHITVENHKTGHRSEFRFSDVDYRKPIDPEAFNANALHRGP